MAELICAHVLEPESPWTLLDMPTKLGVIDLKENEVVLTA